MGFDASYSHGISFVPLSLSVFVVCGLKSAIMTAGSFAVIAQSPAAGLSTMPSGRLDEGVLLQHSMASLAQAPTCAASWATEDVLEEDIVVVLGQWLEVMVDRLESKA